MQNRLNIERWGWMLTHHLGFHIRARISISTRHRILQDAGKTPIVVSSSVVIAFESALRSDVGSLPVD